MVFCPFCDGYGIIYKAKVISTSSVIFICDECDTMWDTHEILAENCLNFKVFMQHFGLKGLWSELDEAGVYNHK